MLGARMQLAAAGRAPGAGPFDPLSITWHTAFWAEGPNMDAQAYADQDPVSLWPDESGNGRDASQATGAQQPEFHSAFAALNNQPAVKGDADDWMDTAAWTELAQPNTIVSVMVFDTLTTNGAYVAYDGLASGSRHQMWAQITSGADDWRLYAGSTLVGGTYDDIGHLFIAEFDATDSLEVDGSVVASGNAGAQGLGGLTLFNTNPHNAAMRGAIAFIGIYDGLLTAQQKADLRAWATGHYGTP